MNRAKVIKLGKGKTKYFALQIGDIILKAPEYLYETLDDPKAWFTWVADQINR